MCENTNRRSPTLNSKPSNQIKWTDTSSAAGTTSPSSSPPSPRSSLLHLYLHSSACSSSFSAAGPHDHRRHQQSTLPLVPFPSSSSSCDPSLSSRDLLTPDKRFKKLAASSAFKKRSASFAYLFDVLRSLSLLSNTSRVLCVSSGAGHDAHALFRSGFGDVTAVDLVEFPPLVKRSDPHNLPFFDGIFDLGFSAGLNAALYPMRFVEEMERTVRKGEAAAAAAAAAAESDEELERIKVLFRRSSVVEVRNITLIGDHMSLIVMRNNGNPS